MKRKTLIALANICLLSAGSTIPLSACSCSRTSRAKFNIYPYEQQFFKTPKVSNKIIAVEVPYSGEYGKLRNSWLALLISIQGILAQTEARMFVYAGSPELDRWFAKAQKEMNFEVVQMSPKDAVKHFLSTNQIKNKYVRYDRGEKNVGPSNATVISAVEGYPMATNRADFIKILKEMGFEEGDNANAYTSKQIFDKYKGQLSNKMLFNLHPDRIFTRDYAIASKSFVFYYNHETDQDYIEEVLNWVESNSPVLGWADEEIGYIELLSKHNLAAVGSDSVANLSLFSGYKLQTNEYQYYKEKIKPEQGKHYVAIVMSDGDNLCWLQNNWATDQKWYASKKRGKFPMNWTFSPSTIDLHPQLIDMINETCTPNDYFVCSHSGYGYANYTQLKDPQSFAKSSAQYMKNCDMSITYNLDPNVKDPSNMSYLLNENNVRGVVWGYGPYYAAAKGGVHWYNNKPVISVRETLWNNGQQGEMDFTATNIAKRINRYTTNPNEISGYTIINAHCWSYGNMDDINNLVSQLDSHVQVVTCEQLFDMVTENVPHTNVEEANDYPEFYKS